MRNEIFVNVAPRETRVAVREQDQIVELHIERDHDRRVVSNCYIGRVTRVLPGMQAAFVDIGLERAGFLYVADYRDESGENPAGNGGRRRAAAAQRGAGAQIQDLLAEGQEIMVQVSKEPLGTKGARITSRISLPGRHLVLMPWVRRVGVSRRIEGDRERRRLRAIVEKFRPKDLGFIVRTVSHGVSEADIKADIEYLNNLWEEIQKRRAAVTEAPALIYEEPPLRVRILRDLVTHETKQVVVDDADAYGEMQDFVQRFMAAPRPKIAHHKGDLSLFEAQRIEENIDQGLGRKVWLKSGGYLIFDQSEALTAIDVNTGRFTGGKSRNLEETILKTNLEACKEIVHQLRFRNIGGLVILDLIDMEIAANREKVYRALQDALKEDKAKVNLLKISELGLVEMTRRRTRENLVQQLCDPCPTCEGTGHVQSPITVSQRVLRQLPKSARHFRSETLIVNAHPAVVDVLTGIEAESIEQVARSIDRKVEIRPNATFHQEQFEISAVASDTPRTRSESDRGRASDVEPVAVEIVAREPVVSEREPEVPVEAATDVDIEPQPVAIEESGKDDLAPST